MHTSSTWCSVPTELTLLKLNPKYISSCLGKPITLSVISVSAKQCRYSMEARPPILCWRSHWLHSTRKLTRQWHSEPSSEGLFDPHAWGMYKPQSQLSTSTHLLQTSTAVKINKHQKSIGPGARLHHCQGTASPLPMLDSGSCSVLRQVMGWPGSLLEDQCAIAFVLKYKNRNSSRIIMEGDCTRLTLPLCRHWRTLLYADPLTHRKDFSEVRWTDLNP